MDTAQLEKHGEYEWLIPAHAGMHVPGVLYGSEELVRDMDQKVFDQVCNVARLPGIVEASYAMPDAHWGYGFPIGGVAAFDPEQNGVISAGGVGFDISCGVRLLKTGMRREELSAVFEKLADRLYESVPSGVGSRSGIRLNDAEMDAMLEGGARWAVEKGWGEQEDLEHIEENGCMNGACPQEVSPQAKKRQKPEMGTLGSGNHYLEMQEVTQIFDKETAQAFDLNQGDIVISIHCGSRGLGHQIGTDFLKEMNLEANRQGLTLPDRELACAPINSPTGQSYLGAMRAGMNCAMANRQIITHFAREAFNKVVPETKLRPLYDVSHNTCKEEWHNVNGQKKRLFVHRKGATRAFGPGNMGLPRLFQSTGQPVVIGGSMGTASYVLVGTEKSEELSFSSSCHGAGRAMSRRQAKKHWTGEQVVQNLAEQGTLVRSGSYRGVAEEAPGAYKDVDAVVDAAHRARLSTKVVQLKPLISIKG